MKKLFTDREYSQSCISANMSGQTVYIKTHEEEIETVIENDYGEEEHEKQTITVAELVIAPEGYYICTHDNYTDGTVNPNYEQEAAARKRLELDALTLTPADVERALYKAKQMDFDDLKALIASQLPQIDMKALSIEFRAKDFFRGATAGGQRLFDVVGMLLGYTSDDMDYLFINKELPSGD